MSNKPQAYNVLCFTFAGGNSYSYRDFSRYYAKDLNLIAFDYPGRGKRMGDSLIKDVDGLVEDMYQQIIPYLDKPYMIYGHSMGAMVGFQLTHFLRKLGKRLPDGLFITGCRAPTAWSGEKFLHKLPYDELVEELQNMGGMPPNILRDKDFMGFYEPIIRADFTVLSTYQYLDPIPLSIPLKVITATSEDIPEADASKWKEVTTGETICKRLEGDHFFIFDYPKTMMQEMLDCKRKWQQDAKDQTNENRSKLLDQAHLQEKKLP